MLATEPESRNLDFPDLPYVELSFKVQGEALPADHGYGLYSAIAHILPEIHQQEGLSIQTIAGIPDKQGKIHLTNQSRLRIRLPGDQVPLVYPLAGKQLTIGIHSIRLGIPQIFMLPPASTLRSRIVTIKGFQEPDPFLEAVKRQLDSLEIQGTASIPLNLEGQPDRKAIKIKKYSVVGFGLEVSELNEEDSIKLQIYGLGGKHRMGCGIFAPLSQRWRLIYG